MTNKVEIGILGTGAIGSAFARHLVKAGHRVRLANRRGPDSLRSLVDELGPAAAAATASEVARLEIVFVAITWPRIPEALRGLPPWDGRIVIDANNHIIGFEGGRFKFADLRGRTSSEVFADMVPGARVVKAFNTLPAALLAQEPRVENGRRVIFLSGDDVASRKTVSDLISSAGFAPVDLGSLSAGGQLQQAGAPLSALNLIQSS